MLQDPITGKPKRGKDQLVIITLLVVIIALLLIEIFPFVGNMLDHGRSSGTGVPVGYATILLYNNQSKATSTNFDQLISIDWSQFHSYLNENLDNVAFFSSTSFNQSNELYAWVENNASYSYSASDVWVNLSSNVIPADGSLPIYMVFLSKNATWTKYFGEAPTLSPTYGSFDNGRQVFPMYENFSGVNLAYGWISTTHGQGSVEQKNGLYLEYPYFSYAGVETVKTYPAPMVFETYEDINDASGVGGSAPMESLSTNTAFNVPYWSGGYEKSYYQIVNTDQDSTNVINKANESYQLTPQVPSGNQIVRGVEWNSTGSIYGLMNDGYIPAFYSNDTTWSIGNYHFALGGGTGSGTSGITVVHWVRARTPPPNNIMPATSLPVEFQNISSVSTVAHASLFPCNQGSMMASEKYSSANHGVVKQVILKASE